VLTWRYGHATTLTVVVKLVHSISRSMPLCFSRWFANTPSRRFAHTPISRYASGSFYVFYVHARFYSYTVTRVSADMPYLYLFTSLPVLRGLLITCLLSCVPRQPRLNGGRVLSLHDELLFHRSRELLRDTLGFIRSQSYHTYSPMSKPPSLRYVFNVTAV